MIRWGPKVHKRADKDHAAKKLVRKQKRHLRAIKSDRQLRLMVLASRTRQPR